GLGAPMWGANAVNGVINIITKSAKDTQGVYASAGAGTFENAFGEFRYGARANEELAFRVYGKYFTRNDLDMPGGGDGDDRWFAGRGGFRADWDLRGGNALMLEGEGFAGDDHNAYSTPSLTSPPAVANRTISDNVGGHVVGRWTRTLDGDGQLSLQTYYNRLSWENSL